MTQRDVLFWVFTGFFVLIGLVSLSVMLGFPTTADRRLREWAVRGFFVGVTTAIFGLFKVAVINPAAALITVTLIPPAGLTDPLLLKGGQYSYDEIDANQRVVTHTGAIVPGLSEGGWHVKLPAEVSDKPVRLLLNDEKGGTWVTDPFYPNYTRQAMRTGKLALERTHQQWAPPGVAVLSAAEAADVRSQQQATIKFANYARKVNDLNGQSFYEWRVFVAEPPDVLSRIAQVDYLLHPTFPQPFQSTSNRGSQFDLTATGWGEFRILITVHYTDGKQAKTSYWLSLTNPWPAPASGVRVTLDTIHVEWDGSPGATGWIFDVSLNGKPLMTLPNRSYDDGRGGSRRKPSDYTASINQGVVGTVPASKGQPIRIDVRGKRSFGGDTAVGTGTIDSGGKVLVNVVNGKNPRNGSFVFSFSAAPAQASGS